MDHSTVMEHVCPYIARWNRPKPVFIKNLLHDDIIVLSSINLFIAKIPFIFE